ncbi:MAG: serine/threonine-protein kinase [Mycobacterium sp.]
MPTPGDVLHLKAAAWTVREEVYSRVGGFGTLYVVDSLERPEAIAKLVEKTPGAERELLISESVKAASFRNVVPVWDQGETVDHWVIVMPRATHSLADHLADRGALGPDEAVPILVDIANALADIDGAIVHRDLKPDNVLLLNRTWCLADFGIARYAQNSTSADTHKFSWTPSYAAPEQWRHQHATSAADVYAFGVIAYETVTGRVPFPGPSSEDLREQHLGERAPTIPVGPTRFRHLIEDCLNKVPETRPAPTELARRLGQVHIEPISAGFQKLADVHRGEQTQKAAEQAAAIAQQERSEQRDLLHHSALAVFDRLITPILDAITELAPTASIEYDVGGGKMLFVATLKSARIGLALPYPCETDWSMPFTVISESVVSVNLHDYQFPTDYRGRAHSLWYCNATHPGRFAWHELAFMEFALNLQPSIVPFSMLADERARQIVDPSYQVVGSRQLARPIREIDLDDPHEFLDRWLGWFADGAIGQLHRPGQLPEEM